MALVLDLQKIIVWYGNRQAPYKDIYKNRHLQ